jgi:hypothetical protein
MTDGGAVFQPGARRAPVPLRPRSVYAGLDAFGDGDGAVLVEMRVSRNLRLAAESATQEGRIAGGLLYGRGFVDEKGAYLVVSGYLEAGSGEDRSDRVSRGGSGEFTLSEPDLRMLRRDAARTYTSSVEAGWWRSLPAAGEFASRDLETQRALVGPGGAGLLVFGSGLDWGTAYLGPEAVQVLSADPGLDPDAELDADMELDADPGLDPDMELDADAELDDDTELDAPSATEPLAPAVPVTTLATRRLPVLTPAPRPTGRREVSPVRKPEREWGVKEPNPSYVGPEIPTEAKIIVGLLCVVVIAAAIMIGMLVSDALAAVIVGVVGFLVICAFLWFSRL